MSKDNGGSAFPIVGDNGMKQENSDGMTLRDYFAAAALTGMLADHTRDNSRLEYAHYAYVFADAMLKERAK